MFGSAESEHPSWLLVKLFRKNSYLQCMWSQSTNVTDRQTYRRHAIARPRFAL